MKTFNFELRRNEKFVKSGQCIEIHEHFERIFRYRLVKSEQFPFRDLKLSEVRTCQDQRVKDRL